MSIFHSKIHFKGKTNIDMGLKVVEFDPIVGATSGFLGMEPVAVKNFDGSRDFDFGAKFNERIKVNMSLIKNDASDFSVEEVRNTLRWISGSRSVAWLDLYRADNSIDYSILGRFVEINMQKMDSRIVGVRVAFQSVSPWAYSAVQTSVHQIDGSTLISIQNDTDDLDACVYPTVIFENTTGNELAITNNSIGKDVTIKNLAVNETITMDSNQVIHSDNTVKIFGDDFNYEWLMLVPGTNSITVSGNGILTISYRYPIKIGDVAVNISDILPVCEGGALE